MKHAHTIIHAIALVALFATFGQPGHSDKPAGVRRAVETSAGPAKTTAFLEIRQRNEFYI